MRDVMPNKLLDLTDYADERNSSAARSRSFVPFIEQANFNV